LHAFVAYGVEADLESGIHPKINDTTLRLARILARYTPCRPGMACLVRSLNVKERCVQYHLGYLREAGVSEAELERARARLRG